MQLRKYRWSKHYESAEEELFNFLSSRNIDAVRWSAEAGETTENQPVPSDRQLFCVEGSAVVDIAGKRLSLQPGDALDLPTGSAYTVVAGMTGVVLYLNA